MKSRIPVIAFILLISSMSICAQSATTIKIPSQLGSAKTIFVGYEGAPMGIDTVPGIPVTLLVITGVQEALSKSGRYTQVDKPGDAELSCRLSVQAGYGLRLAVFDTKTGALLWTIDEPFNWGVRKETIIKNINDATSKVVSDLDALASGTAAFGPTKPLVQHHSDEGKK